MLTPAQARSLLETLEEEAKAHGADDDPQHGDL